VIPARSGSKRLPNKNILELHDKPLIAWSIEAGLKSKYIDKLVVSTDSEQIKAVSLTFGAEVPFIRPKELATDTATSYDVVKHVVDSYGKGFDIIILLQPTSPLRTSLDIDAAVEFFIDKNADAVISVCEVEHTPLHANTLPQDLSLKGFLNNDIKSKRSQDLDKYYRINGALYLVSATKFMEERTFFIPNNIYAYVMPQNRSVDIDTELDLNIAKAILNDKKN